MNKSSLRLWIVFYCLWFSGCSTLPKSLPLTDTQRPSELTQWQMRGKLAVITPDERRAVNFFWQRNDATYQTVITTSLGLQVLSATRNQSGLELTADGQTYASNVPEQLILELTGWQLPIDQLNHWLIADVREEDGVVSKNDQGVITEFMPTCFVIDKQTCPTPMRVTYSDYRKVNKVSLPHRITLIMGAQTFRLKVSGWN